MRAPCDAPLTESTPNNPVERTAHSPGFCGYSWDFPLRAAAHRERWADQTT
jgi:hypothetical protein